MFTDHEALYVTSCITLMTEITVESSEMWNMKTKNQKLFYLSVVLPGKLTENTFSITATTWGIVTGERRGVNEPIVNWSLLGDRDGLRARLGI